MQPLAPKEPRGRKNSESHQARNTAMLLKKPSYSLPVLPRDHVQMRIADRAYELYAERGYRQGYALDDWLEAEREILSLECDT